MMVGPLEIEVTHYATPCSKNARWFVDGRYNRMHENRHPGESRVYARVISGGVMRAGDAVELLG
jgi:MOSC domain-containing protein YiiM